MLPFALASYILSLPPESPMDYTENEDMDGASVINEKSKFCSFAAVLDSVVLYEPYEALGMQARISQYW